jgi:glycosyltransferase involved in cell wall biosynthesis
VGEKRLLGSLLQVRRWLLKHGAPEGSHRRRLLRGTKIQFEIRRERCLDQFLPKLQLLLVGIGVKPKARPVAVHDTVWLLRFFERFGGTELRWSAADAGHDELAAARFALGVLQTRPDLRQRFPHAVTAGVEGDYCRWLCTQGAQELGLSPEGVANVRTAFAREPGERIWMIYDHWPLLRSMFPVALIPAGQRSFAQWLLRNAKAELQIVDEEIWWFLEECAEDPCGGIAAAYLRHPGWQKRFPTGLTAFGFADLMNWLRRHYRLRKRLVRRLGRPSVFRPTDELRMLYDSEPGLQRRFKGAFQDPAATRRLARETLANRSSSRLNEGWRDQLWKEIAAGLPEKMGVNILAHFCYPSGLGEAAKSNVRALHHVGIPTACRDVPTELRADRPGRRNYLDLERFDTTLVHVPPEPPVRNGYSNAGLAKRPGVRRIAVWYWELESVPHTWVEQARDLHEIWAPTRFIGRAMRAVMPVPVVDMLPGVELGAFHPLSRRSLGLPEDRVLFLFLFDMCSIMERKNPLGLIRAFRKAFRGDDRAALAIKVTRGDFYPEDLRRLEEEARSAGALVIDRILSREEAYGLIAACDCYVSLHRSEGFGLTMAEAMLMGKPVIATGYSGNLDFMTPSNSRLVDYTRIAIAERLPIYRQGCVWADPSTEQAAAWMRWVYANPEEAKALGERARTETRQLLSLEAAGRRMAQRLHGLRGEIRRADGRRAAA